MWGGMEASQGEACRREREDGGRGRGMLRCVWMRLSTGQMRRAGGTWRRRVETGVAQEVWLRVRVRVRAAERGRKPRMLRCVWREAIHDAGAAQAARGGAAQRQACCRQRRAGAAAAGRRQPGPRGSLCPTCVFSSGVRSSGGYA